MTVPEALAAFARIVHLRVPDSCSIDLHTEEQRARGICGEHGRVNPTRQNLCPKCGGYVEDAAAIARLREMAVALKSHSIYDREHIGYIRLQPHFNPRPGV